MNWVKDEIDTKVRISSFPFTLTCTLCHTYEIQKIKKKLLRGRQLLPPKFAHSMYTCGHAWMQRAHVRACLRQDMPSFCCWTKNAPVTYTNFPRSSHAENISLPYESIYSQSFKFRYHMQRWLLFLLLCYYVIRLEQSNECALIEPTKVPIYERPPFVLAEVSKAMVLRRQQQ